MTGEFLTSLLWDAYLPGWRQAANAPSRRTSASDRAAVADINSITPVANGSLDREHFDSDSADFLKIIRHIPVHKGKWRVLPESAIPPQERPS